MKYIEELNNGDSFELDNNFYVLTSDFKKSGDRLSYSLKTYRDWETDRKSVV